MKVKKLWGNTNRFSRINEIWIDEIVSVAKTELWPFIEKRSYHSERLMHTSFAWYFIRTQFHYLPIKSPVISYDRPKSLSHELQRGYRPSISKLDRCVVNCVVMQTGLNTTSQTHLFVWLIRYDWQVFNFRASVMMSKFKTLAFICKMTN